MVEHRENVSLAMKAFHEVPTRGMRREHLYRNPLRRAAQQAFREVHRADAARADDAQHLIGTKPQWQLRGARLGTAYRPSG